MNARIIIIACGSAKKTVPSRAIDLYTGGVFAKRRAFAEQRGGPHFILSAKYRLILPSRIVRPYDQTMLGMSREQRLLWAYAVRAQLLEYTAPGDTIVVLAGALYVKGWRTVLEAAGRYVKHPFRKLRIGQQLAALKAGTRP